MEKTAVFYGSTTGNTESIANLIAEGLGAELFEVSINPEDRLNEFNNLIFGTSTWGVGDLQDDWEQFIGKVEEANLEGKVIALFGCGDGVNNPDSFVGGMAHIFNAIKDKNCKIIGQTDPSGYEFDNSDAIVDGQFVGLPIDEDNQSDLTEERIERWVSEIKLELF